MDNSRRNTINDCYVDVFNERPSVEEINFIKEQLPGNIKSLADKWGWNDTEVGDKVYIWIQENKKSLK